jgi:hypothetical protein
MADSPFFKAPHQRYPDLPQQGGLYLARNFDEVQRFISGPKGVTTLRVTSTTRPSSPYSGQPVYETDTGSFSFWNGSAWSPIGTGAWTTYTPVLTASVTNPTLGSGAVQNGRYTKIGRTVIGQAAIFFGTAGVANGIGEYRFSLPAAAGTEVEVSSHNTAMGHGHLYDSSTNTLVAIVVEHGPGQMGYFLMFKTTGTGVTAQFTVTENSPWVWAASDQLIITFAYETTS